MLSRKHAFLGPNIPCLSLNKIVYPGTQDNFCNLGLQEYMILVHALVRLATPFAPISAYSTTFELKYALNLTKSTRLFVDEKFLPTVVPVATELGIDPNHIYFIKGNSKSRKSFWSIIENVRRNKIWRVDTRTATKKYLGLSRIF